MVPTTGTPNISQNCQVDHNSKATKQNIAKNLLELWKKGQHHLDTAWELW